MKPHQYPVVITAADHPTGLITARSLIDSKAHLIGLYRNPDMPTCKSRLWSGLYELGESRNQIETNLIEIGKRCSQKPVLLPIQDDMVQWVSQKRELLSRYFVFNLASEKTIDLLLDKAAFHPWAEANGFLVPESYILSDNRALQRKLEELDFKAIIKPYLKTEAWDRLNPRDKVLKIDEPKDLEKIPFDLFVACPKLVVQRWIPGGDDNVFFCLTYFNRRGEDIGCFAGRKLHQWPVDCGSTAVAVSDNGTEVAETTKHLFRSLNYKGLGSVEFKKNPADGRFYIIEPTVGRNDLQSYVSVRKGLNLTKLAFEDLVEQKAASVKPWKTPTIWLNEETMIDSLRRNPANTAMLVTRLLKLMVSSRISFAYFHFRDPAPFLWLFLGKIASKGKQLFGRQRILSRCE